MTMSTNDDTKIDAKFDKGAQSHSGQEAGTGQSAA